MGPPLASVWRVLLACSVLSACVGGPPATPSIEEQAVSTILQSNVDNSLSLGGAISIHVPQGAVPEDTSTELRIVGPMPGAYAGTYSIVGDPFEFRLAQGDAFDRLVTISIPYSLALLPSNVPEANLFAVFLHEGQWTRVWGEVDQARDVIVVQTLHNGIWSWAFDTLSNFTGDVRAYLGEVSQRPQTLEEAIHEEERRYAEWLSRWSRCEIIAQELGNDINLQNLFNEIADNVYDQVQVTAVEMAVLGLPPKAAILLSGGSAVASITGAVGTGLYIGPIIGNSVLGTRCVLLWADAHHRLREAQAVVQALQHPDQTSFHPDYAQALEEFLGLQMQQDIGAQHTLDWSLTAHPDSDVDSIIGAATPRAPEATVAPTETATPVTPAQPSTGLLTVTTSARCRAGPGSIFGVIHYFSPGEQAVLLGQLADNSWYYIQRLDDPRESRNCWLAANLAEVEAPGQVMPFIPVVTPPPTPTTAPAGSVRVRLMWSEQADLDLHVVDPIGNEVSFSHMTSANGGQLDHDANWPCSSAIWSPQENISWPDGAAPTGDYTVVVDYFSECFGEGPVDFRLTIWVDGAVVLDTQDTLQGEDAQAWFTFRR